MANASPIATLAFVACDSPQATAIPKEHLLRQGLAEADYTTRCFDLAVGKHGDHIGGELEAFRCLQRNDEAASGLIDLNWKSWTVDGTIDPTDPAEELEFAVALLNQVTAGFDAASRGARIGLHICRGNWSTNEATLLRGGYHPLAPYLERMQVDQVVLEYATERAGELVPLAGKELGLGVVNPRTPRIETVAEIRARIERALQHYPPERLFVNPDCGFATFSNRPVNSLEIAIQKLRAMVTAVQELRGGA